MRIPVRLRFFVFPLLLAAVTQTQAATLHSPWDNRKVEQTAAAYDCPAPPPFAKTLDISPYYIDGHASIIDPDKQAAYQKASEATTHLSQFAALAADAYLYKGSRAAAFCVYSLLEAAAKAEAWAGKMPGFSGVYVQNWLLSAVAVSYLKVRPAAWERLHRTRPYRNGSACSPRGCGSTSTPR